MSDDVLAHLRALRNDTHRLRQAEAEARRQYNAALEQWKLGVGGELEAQLARCVADARAAESCLRKAALAKYNADFDPHPTAGVTVRLMTRLEYDVDIAKAWAMEHRLSLALTLNEQGFDKIAKVLPNDVPFVTISHEPQARIATDLGRWAAIEGEVPCNK